MCLCKTDVVGRVRNGETPPFRPRDSSGSSVELVDSRLVDLMQQCWLEDPAHRPTVGAVLTRFTEITQIQSVFVGHFYRATPSQSAAYTTIIMYAHPSVCMPYSCSVKTVKVI